MRVIKSEQSGDVLPALVTPETLIADSGGGLKAGDPRLAAAAQAASNAIRRYCRWHIAPVIEETMILDGSGGSVQQLKSAHVVDILEMKIGGITFPPSHYAWSEDGLIELHSKLGQWARFPKMFRSVEVTLQHGFDEVPDLSAIASQIARFALASPMGRTREQAGQIAVSWGTAEGMRFSESALEMMKPYRIQTMP